jgi:C-terminal processing protease CtpA/Prc
MGVGLVLAVTAGGVAASAVPSAPNAGADPWRHTFTSTAYQAEAALLLGERAPEVVSRDLPDGAEIVAVPDLLVRGTSQAVASAATDAHGVVLDLRGSRGGLVTEAVDVAGVFLDQGRGLSYTRADGTSRVLPLPDDGIALNAPLVVLVDDRTASAAEALAGVLRDHGRAVIVGESTFGKGTVQEPRTGPDGTVVRGTVGAYVLPSGAGIGTDGVRPDVVLADASDDEAALDAARRVLAGLVDGGS